MSIHSRWSALAPVAVAAALVVSGCGGGGTSKNDYVKSLNKAEAALTQQLNTISGGITASDPGAASALFDKSGKAIDAAADDFNNITPPDDAASAHKKIVDGLHKLAGSFRDAAKTKDPAKLQEALTAIQSSAGAKELAAADQELAAAGYKVQGQ